MKQPIWDLPTRLFHWLLAALIIFSWWSAEYHETDLHIWSGIAILSLLVFRLLWGFFGSSTARFTNFVRGPRAILGYMKDRASWRLAGHTPLGGVSVVALLGAIAVQVALGLISTDEDGFYEGPLARLVSIDASEAARELHEQWFYVVLALVGMHVAAIIFYRIKGWPLTKAMITGAGELDPGVEPMRRGRWWLALICLAIAIGTARWVVAGAPPFGG